MWDYYLELAPLKGNLFFNLLVPVQNVEAHSVPLATHVLGH